MKKVETAVPSNRLTFSLIIFLSLAAAPHLWHLNPRIIGPFYAMALLRIVAIFYPRLLPSRWVLFILMIMSLINVLIVGFASSGTDAGVSLLTAMLGLKLLELRTERDIYILVFLGFFLIVTLFLFDQGMGYTLYLFLISLGLIGVLVDMNGNRNVYQSYRYAGLMFLAAIPAMLVLFVLFPRLSGPLWSIGTIDMATTGITDHIRPGEVSQLSQSSEVAFRVLFKDEPPPPIQRYWRGPVLWQTDGATWTRLDDLTFAAPNFKATGPRYDYELTIEKTNQRWIFPLELPANTIQGTRWTADFQLLTLRSIQKRRTFSLSSYADFESPMTNFDEQYSFEYGLQLPDNITPRMQQLADAWRDSGKTDEGVVQAALRHFTEQPFHYTLSPPKLGDNPTDEFLFDTRSGFCGHYATSFALMMRLAGIPARVVAGYQGGEFNPVGGHLIVRQSDAHAWAEVWLDDKGWVRVDPTSAVSPDRIERSIQPADTGEVGAPVLFRLDNPGAFANLLRQAGWMIDNLDLQWHRWVVGFTKDTQRWVLDELGLGFLEGYALGLAATSAGILALFTGLILFRIKGRSSQEAIQNAYLNLRRHLNFAGLSIPGWLGPKDLSQQAATNLPALSKELQPLLRSYMTMRYEDQVTTKEKRLFIWQTRLFRLRTIPIILFSKWFNFNRLTQ